MGLLASRLDNSMTSCYGVNGYNFKHRWINSLRNYDFAKENIIEFWIKD